MTGLSDAPGAAALAICKSLLSLMTKLKIISDREVRGLLTDVASAHSEPALTSKAPDKDQAVVAIVLGILHPAGRDPNKKADQGCS